MRALPLLVLVGCAVDPSSDTAVPEARVELGRYLFYDTRLSANGTQSCASCHRQELAFTDGGATSLGSTGARGRRSAMSLANVGLAGELTWDGRVSSLEQQALLPMYGTAPVELGLDRAHDGELLARIAAEPRYAALFPAAFTDEVEPFSVANISRALAAFQRTIISDRSRFDHALAGEVVLTPREQLGRDLFESERLGCASCHAGPTIARTDGVYFNTGLYNLDGAGAYPTTDRGLAEVTNNAQHEGRFRPPTLRNIAVTAPYMHDGSAGTLDDVIAAYERGGRLIDSGPLAGDGAASPLKAPQLRGFTLTPDERVALLAFLGSTTDEHLLTDPTLGDPW